MATDESHLVPEFWQIPKRPWLNINLPVRIDIEPGSANFVFVAPPLGGLRGMFALSSHLRLSSRSLISEAMEIVYTLFL
ncbi:hypothetical protein WA1_43040 [Scytonema hofmannii PCC 7110]|uniref:Uncharacterized protein n=1 Tax=Scytonema hofmannii PCC 7110 TaxID=128403 RepID=A0A139WVL3_9CYAN|nr:hypothetical protein [Scytonema hofmannii]KYC36476.1 hypothetical protein WA1_43040 [Scytonema hofmannii PCC 7110]